MFQWLKDHFVPHEGNDHRPHFLRTKTIATIVAFILVLEILYLFQTLFIVPRSGFLAEVISSVLVEQTNEERVADALSLLRPNPLLEEAARIKAEDMALRGYFSHNTPDGKTPWYFLQEVGYPYQSAGENLAVNFSESRDVTDAWMRSPGHRANILNGTYTEIGIATAQGVYKGNDAIFVVQFFGKPKLAVASVTPTVPTVQVLAETATASSPVLGVTTVLPQVSSEKPAEPIEVPLVKEVEGPKTPVSVVNEVPESVQAETVVSTPPAPESESSFASTDSDTPVIGVNDGKSPGLISRIMASPRIVLSTLLVILAAVVLIALILAIFIKIRIQHPHIIGNAVLTLAIIGALLLMNSLIAQSLGVIF